MDDSLNNNNSIKSKALRKKPKSSTSKQKKVDNSAILSQVNSYFCFDKKPATSSKIIIPYNKVKDYDYVMTRQYNKKFDDIKFPNGSLVVNSMKAELLSMTVFTTSNYLEFQNLHSKPEKDQFVVNIIMDNNLSYNIVKIDEHETEKNFYLMHHQDIFDSLYKGFSKGKNQNDKANINKHKNKARSTKDNQDNGTKNSSKSNESDEKKSKFVSTRDKCHPINSYLSYDNMYPGDESQDQWMQLVLRYDSMKNSGKNYNTDHYKQELSHSHFSLIHPLYEPYELCVYNGSHRHWYTKNEKPTIHGSTLLKLRIPCPLEAKNTSFFVIFDSKLVHFGSKTSRGGLLSSQFRHNYRLFGYVIQSYQGTQIKSGCNDISNDIEDFTLMNMRKDIIDNGSFNICDKLKCIQCTDAFSDNKSKVKEEQIVDVLQEFNNRGTSKIPNRPGSYICGDLDLHGWEIHEGIRYMKDSDRYKFLRLHLEQLQLSGGRRWNTVTSSRGRHYMQIEDTHDGKKEVNQVTLSQSFVSEICFPEIAEIVKSIDGFHNHEIQGQLLLANRAICNYQYPHRDYVLPATNDSTNDTLDPTDTNVSERNNVSGGRRFSKRRRNTTDRYSSS